MKRYIATLLILLLVVSSFAIVVADDDPAATQDMLTETTDRTFEPVSEGPVMIDAAANSEDNTPETHGTCGDNLEWTYFAGTNTLEVSGYGDMYDYTFAEPAPWTPFNENINTVRLLGGNDQGAITSIGNFSFANCINLTKVIMQGGEKEIKYVGICAFYSCFCLSDSSYSLSIALADDATFGSSAFACTGLTSFCLPPETKSISNGMFRDCGALEHIYGCENVTSMGDEAFAGCTSLVSFDVPSGLASIPNRAFWGCTSLESVNTTGSTIKKIGKSAFEECRSLTSFYMPDSLKELSDRSFYQASSLQNIYFNSILAEIPPYAFSSCTSLTKVHIPRNIKTIGENAFLGCTALTDIFLDDGVKYIEEGAFSNCAIEAAFLPTTIKRIKSNVFAGDPLESLCIFSNSCEVWNDFRGQNDSESLIVWGVTGSNIQEDLAKVGIKTGTMGPMASDLLPRRYYYLAANYIIFRDYIGWLSDTDEFLPNQGMTRANMLVMLWKIEGCPISKAEQTPFFTDVPNDAFYKHAVYWAYEKRITTGTSSTKFSPNRTITRAQAITMLYRYAQYKKADTTQRAYLGNYTDENKIPDYAKIPFQWAVANKIIVGTTLTTISPNSRNSRAQAVTILCRFLETVENAPNQN